MKFRQMLIGAAALAVMIAGPAGAAGAAGNANSGTGACDSGTIAPGTYSSVTITGFCMFQPGVYRINGGLTLATGAGADLTNCDTHITITGGVTVGQDAILGLGGSVNGTGCEADTNDIVHGGLRATGAAAVIVHGTHVDGGFSINGGGFSTDCEGGIPGFGPAFSDIEDSSINGGLSVTGLNTCWFGTLRVQINGGMLDMNNTFGDPDANEVQTNTIHGNLVCNGNSPAVQQGDSEGEVNIVSGQKIGECSAPGI